MGGSRGPENENDSSRLTAYRWTCPICDESGTSVNDAHLDEEMVINNLTTHIRSSDGGGHGSQGALPDDIGSSELETHVREVKESID